VDPGGNNLGCLKRNTSESQERQRVGETRIWRGSFVRRGKKENPDGGVTGAVVKWKSVQREGGSERKESSQESKDQSHYSCRVGKRGGGRTDSRVGGGGWGGFSGKKRVGRKKQSFRGTDLL